MFDECALGQLFVNTEVNPLDQLRRTDGASARDDGGPGVALGGDYPANDSTDHDPTSNQRDQNHVACDEAWNRRGCGGGAGNLNVILGDGRASA